MDDSFANATKYFTPCSNASIVNFEQVNADWDYCKKLFVTRNKWDKVFTSRLSKFFKGCLPQNLLSPLLNTLSHLLFA